MTRQAIADARRKASSQVTPTPLGTLEDERTRDLLRKLISRAHDMLEAYPGSAREELQAALRLLEKR